MSRLEVGVMLPTRRVVFGPGPVESGLPDGRSATGTMPSGPETASPRVVA
jgi:hypothetical protein